MEPTPSPIARWLGPLLFVAALAYLAPLRHYGLLINDDGWLLHPTLRMFRGEVLYRDVWSYYAPLRYEFFSALFQLTGASLLVVRWVWLVLIALSVLAVYRVALRFAPWWLAWLPGAVYALVPGPWHKAPYGACTAWFFLLFVRALERPGTGRFVALGAMAGVSLMTRQDLGLAQLGLSALAIAASARFAPAGGAVRPFRAVAVRAAATGGAALAVTLPFLIHYAGQGALGRYLEANFVSAFIQMGAHRSQFGMLFEASAWTNAAPLIFLLPPMIYAVSSVAWIAHVLRRGLDPVAVLIAALIAFATVTLAQAYAPMRLLRLLQSAIPFYWLTTWVIAAFLLSSAAARAAPARRAAALGVGAGAAGLFVYWVVAGAPVILPDDSYTGSVRMRRLDAPVEFLGATFFTEPRQAEEIRAVRAFVGAHTSAGESVFVWPLHSLYYELLGRTNPTRMIHEHIREGDWVQPNSLKSEDMERMLAGGTRYAVVNRIWLYWPESPDMVRRALRANFMPVREYGELVVMRREKIGPLQRQLYSLYGRHVQGTLGAPDRPMARRLAAVFPREPLPHLLLGVAMGKAGAIDAAVDAFEQAARLDGGDPNPWVQAAALRLAQGKRAEASALLSQAERIAATPDTKQVRQNIEAAIRSGSSRRP